MKELILHVGMHKTGTTSIQASLHGLKESGVRYVELGHPNHSSLITATFSDTPNNRGGAGRHLHSPERVRAARERTLQLLASELSSPEFHKFIISGEGIVKLRRRPLRLLREALLEHVDRVHVFAYIRDPVGFTTSALQQRIKGGGDLEELPGPAYRHRFTPFIEVFGAGNVSGKAFARESLKDGSVVADFCDRWGIPFTPAREKRTNESLSEPVVKLLHFCNREGVTAGGRGMKRARLAMIEEMRAHFPGRFVLPERFHGAAVDTEDLDWLAAHFDVDFRPGLPAPSELDHDALLEYLAEIDPAWIESYREMLSRRGLRVQKGDPLLALLRRHFEACLEAVATRNPTSADELVEPDDTDAL